MAPLTKERETMKGMLTAVLCFGLLSGVCVAGERPALKETKDKESYSLGYQFGQNMKAQGVDINLDIYTSGIRDGMSGTTPQLSQDEIRDTVTELQKRVMAARQKPRRRQALSGGEQKERRRDQPPQRFAIQNPRGGFWKGPESHGQRHGALPRNVDRWDRVR
jgi:FKBP-type peptidyl-prolyl cis-trans isomerase